MNADLEKISQKIAKTKDISSEPFDLAFLELLELAVETASGGNYPVAAGIYNKDLDLIVRAGNRSFTPKPISSAHAEMRALDDFESNDHDTTSLQLLTTLEPCLMCTARILLSKPMTVFYLCRDPGGGGVDRIPHSPPEFTTASKSFQFEPAPVSAPVITLGQELYEFGQQKWLDHMSTKRS